MENISLSPISKESLIPRDTLSSHYDDSYFPMEDSEEEQEYPIQSNILDRRPKHENLPEVVCFLRTNLSYFTILLEQKRLKVDKEYLTLSSQFVRTVDLDERFLHHLKNLRSTTILDFISAIIADLDDAITELLKFVDKDHQQLSNKIEEEISDLIREYDTWLLIEFLVKDQKPGENSKPNTPSTFYDLFLALLQQDFKFRRCSLVLEWTQNTFKKTMHYETSPNCDLTDARIYKSYLNDVWKAIRSGELEEAKKICTDRGEQWRAAVLSAALEFKNPYFYVRIPSNNPQLQHWDFVRYLRTLKPLCENIEISTEIERAIYGSLCFRVECALIGARNWQDYLWAHTKTNLDYTLYWNAFNLTNQNDIGFSQLVNNPSLLKTCDLKTIFAAIKNQEQITLDAYAEMQEIFAQTNLNTLGIEGVKYLDSKVAVEASILKDVLSIHYKHHFLRFSAMFVILCQSLNSYQVDEQGRILQTYLQYLLTVGKFDSILELAAFLPKNQQSKCLASIIEKMNDTSIVQLLDVRTKQTEVLQIADKKRFHVQEILLLLMQSAFNSVKSDINALAEDMLFYFTMMNKFFTEDAYILPRLVYVNRLIRFFVKFKLYDSAEQLLQQDVNFAKSSSSSLRTVCLHEFNSWKSFVDGMTAFTKWNDTKEPIAPDSSKFDMKFMGEKVRYQQEVLRYEKAIEQFKINREREEDIMEEKLNEVLQNIKNQTFYFLQDAVLENAVRGELHALHSAFIRDELESILKERTETLPLLRNWCIQLAAFSLLTMFEETKRFEDGLKLASVIAREDNLSAFSQDAAVELVQKLAELELKYLSSQSK